LLGDQDAEALGEGFRLGVGVRVGGSGQYETGQAGVGGKPKGAALGQFRRGESIE
jgi:hypothetical protein